MMQPLPGFDDINPTGQTGSHCFLCGTTQRLETDHINETSLDNRPSNLRTMCKFCHSLKGTRKLGEDDTQRLKSLIDEDPKLLKTLRYMAETTMSQYADTDRFPIEVTTDGTDTYSRDEFKSKLLAEDEE